MRLATRVIGPHDTTTGSQAASFIEQVADWISTLEPVEADAIATKVVQSPSTAGLEILYPVMALAAPTVLPGVETTREFNPVEEAYERQISESPRGPSRLAVPTHRGARAATALEQTVARGTVAVEAALGLAQNAQSTTRPPAMPAPPPPPVDRKAVLEYAAWVRVPRTAPDTVNQRRLFGWFSGTVHRTHHTSNRYREAAQELLGRVDRGPYGRWLARRAAARSASALQSVSLPHGMVETYHLQRSYNGHGFNVGRGPGDDTPPNSARRRSSGPDQPGASGGSSRPHRPPAGRQSRVLTGQRRRYAGPLTSASRTSSERVISPGPTHRPSGVRQPGPAATSPATTPGSGRGAAEGGRSSADRPTGRPATSASGATDTSGTTGRPASPERTGTRRPPPPPPTRPPLGRPGGAGGTGTGASGTSGPGS